MFVLLAVVLSLGIWKLAQFYYRREINGLTAEIAVLERNLALWQNRPPTESQVVKPAVNAHREQVAKTFVNGLPDSERLLLK